MSAWQKLTIVFACISFWVVLAAIIFSQNTQGEFAMTAIVAFAMSFLICVTLVIPIAIAHYRHHRNFLAITVLDVVAGWTFIGWVVALVWACTGADNWRSRSA